MVALTFDAGSDAGNTARILDVLTARGIKATFGLTGRWVEANPGLYTRIVRDGHQTVNHTYDHKSFTGRSTRTAPLTTAQRRAELYDAERIFAARGGPLPRPWFRPPYGDRDASVDRDVAAAGYDVELLWSVDSAGWRGVDRSVVVQRCLAGAAPGAIYLFHVGAASTDYLALDEVITRLAALGYRFGTATQVVFGG